MASSSRSGSVRTLALGLLVLVSLSGCTLYRSAVQSAEPSEATFADPDSVMIRGIEEVSLRAEYFDRKEKAVKVKRWTVRPPFWIVNESMIKARAARVEAKK